MTVKEKAIIVSRCSTNESKQDVTRQTKDLKAKYSAQYNITEEFEYYESGTKNENYNEEILKKCLFEKIENIIFSEVSRISRKMISSLQFIESCTGHKINIIIEAQGLHTLNSDKSENEITKLLLGLLTSFAEMELKQTQKRLNSGRDKYISEGGKLGRNSGSEESKEEFLNKHKDIQKLLKQNFSIRKISKLTDKSTTTIQKVKKLIL
tara:strand:+ start:430 stop:1056 length:627 start_codon:yes stop_codon:yes gene_type:complete